MRALAVSIWVFINLVFFGMCGYMYLLWSQYWLYIERQTITATYSSYDQQIFYYNRGYYPNNTIHEPKSRQKHSITQKDNQTITLIKNSRPRFPNLQPKQFEIDSNRFACSPNDSLSICNRKTDDFKSKIVNELRRVFQDESNILRVGNTVNPYNVQYKGKRGNFIDKSQLKVLCELSETPLMTLKRADVRNFELKNYLPKKSLFENKRFNSCAIVASSGALKDSNLGSLIDSHDLVLRFNNAPTKGFEKDVGKKTTIRLINSQVATKPQFNFLNSGLYKNLTILIWDPSNYSSSLADWLAKPEFDIFPNFMSFRKSNPKSRTFLLNPQTVWDVWDFLQDNSPSALRKNPPSSGFLGLRLLLPYCNLVDIFEYIPSVRVTKRCHYYDPEENLSCTFGVWHPLAAEKLLTLYLNSATDKQTFQTGFVRILGSKNIDCA